MHDVTTIHTGPGPRMQIILSVSAFVSVLGAGVAYGELNARLRHLEADVEKRATSVEIQAIQQDVEEIKAGIREITTRLNTRHDAQRGHD